ncbi:3-hydroxyacyl-CoA dehydrogenase family protein [Bacillus sp. OK048]|nr:3-hydroxyacyl-CoA dehydrogenase family protein [Bacillus sp. OK048]
MQAALVREAFYILDEGIASPEDIDLAITNGPGFCPRIIQRDKDSSIC